MVVIVVAEKTKERVRTGKDVKIGEAVKTMVKKEVMSGEESLMKAFARFAKERIVELNGMVLVALNCIN